MDTFESRLTKIEQENIRLRETLDRMSKRLRRAGVVVASLAAIAVCLGWGVQVATSQVAKDEPLIAKKLIITDPDGITPRIVIEAPGKHVPEGNVQAHISILDDAGAPTASVLQFKDGCGFWADRFGTDKSFLTLMSYGGSFTESASLSMSDGGGGNVPLSLGVSGQDTYFSGRSPKDGSLRFSLETAKGVPSFRLYDKDADPKFLLSFDEKAAPVVRVQDEGIKVPFTAAVKSPVIKIKGKGHMITPPPAK